MKKAYPQSLPEWREATLPFRGGLGRGFFLFSLFFFHFLLFFFHFSFSLQAQVRWVNPLVGTAPSTIPTASRFGRNTEVLGQTLPAVLEPNGMNCWTPQTRSTEQKCVAPYYYDHQPRLQGFRCSHWIVGGCTQDYGSMTICVMMDTLRCEPHDRAIPYKHEDELSTPYYYSVELPTQHILAEMTGTSRCAIFRFTFRQAGTAYMLVEANSDRSEGSMTYHTEDNTVTGHNPIHRINQGKGLYAGYDSHFILNASHTPDSIVRTSNQQLALAFSVNAGDTLLLRTASSFCDTDGARRNLKAEIPHWNFNHTRNRLRDIWNNHLSRIEIHTDDTTELRKFYTALYHASFLPRIINDTDGRYPTFAGSRKKPCRIVRTKPGHDHYGDYSLWDTFRALHPLLTILQPDKTADMMQSLTDMARQGGGWMPIFPCWNSYTSAMTGDHAAAAIADAYLKGITQFDIRHAYSYLRRNATRTPRRHSDYIEGKGRRALNSYLRYGYIPVEDTVPHAYHMREQTTRTLEYALDDHCLALLAQALGRRSDARQLHKRSLNYANVINPQTRQADGRHADGTFIGTADPHTFAYFVTEGAPVHYTFFAPHDPEGLTRLLGGPQALEAALDTLFARQLYWHGNEPCHHIPYLYNYTPSPWKTSATVSRILQTEYRDEPGGLSGNDDAGQMSAWYVLSSLGLYPLSPATSRYETARPRFPRADIHLPSGRTFTIFRSDTTMTTPTHNTQPLTQHYILHQDIMKGGTITM